MEIIAAAVISISIAKWSPPTNVWGKCYACQPCRQDV